MSSVPHHKPPTVLNVPISDFILTPLACASLINEILKNLLYQRSQIPYPYAWMKSIITKKRSEENEKETVKNFTINRHYQIVSTAYDTAENIMLQLNKAFAHFNTHIKEVLFVIGATAVCPKEIFKIQISSLSLGHVERNHVLENSKKQGKILRGIYLESGLLDLIQKTLTCTHTYVFLKLNKSDFLNYEGSIFVPSKPLTFASNMKQTVFQFSYTESDSFSCCDKLEIFQDVNVDSSKLTGFSNSEEDLENSEVWLQSTVSIQGFKNCFINKVPASQLW